MLSRIWIRWMVFARGAWAAVLPLDYHPRENGLVSFRMLQHRDNKAEIRHQRLTNVTGGSRSWRMHAKAAKGKDVLPVTSMAHMEYTVQISVGKQRQLFRVLPDTGSSDLWIPDLSCPTSDCYDHVRYDATDEIVRSSLMQLKDTKNRTAIKANGDLPHFSIEYGSGLVAGTIVCEDVFMANSTQVHHCFGRVTKSQLASFYRNSEMDGVLGLSFQQLKRTPGPIFMKDFAEQSKQNYVFAFYYAAEFEDASKSRLFLGEYNEHCATKPIVFHPVIKPMWWEVEASFSLNPPNKTVVENVVEWLGDKVSHSPLPTGKKFSSSQYGEKKTLLDSGTSMMCLPEPIVHQLETELDKLIAANPTVSPKELQSLLDSQLSTLQITIGKETYSLRGSDLTACTNGSKAKDGTDGTLMCAINADTAKKCCEDIQEGCHILGMAFFRAHYVVFKMNSPDGIGATVGIAPANHNSSECGAAKSGIQLAQKDEVTADERKSNIGFQSKTTEELIGPEHAPYTRLGSSQGPIFDRRKHRGDNGSNLRGRLSPM